MEHTHASYVQSYTYTGVHIPVKSVYRVQIASEIKERRTRFAGHCYRRKDEVVSNLILWTPKHGKAKVG